MVHILIGNEHGEILICRRPPNKPSYSGRWTSSAGGHVELGETYKEAATRELKEELGLSLPLQDLGQFKVCDQHGNCVHHLFPAVHFDTPLMANYAEVTEYRWGHPHTI